MITLHWYNKKSMSNKQAGFADQRGMVSFLVTMIMMIVITLIVVGFSDITRRNVRETLDHQLSAQAFYAAESGINVTQKTIIDYVNTSGYAGLATKNTCVNEYDPTTAAGTAPIAQLSSGVRYTCVLVNPKPSSLQFSANQGESTITPITADDVLKSLNVSWSLQDGGSQTACAGGNDYSFAPSDTWGNDCDLGVLRLDLIANPSTSATSVAALASNTITIFLTPRGTHNAAVTVGFGGSTTGYVVSGKDAGGSGTCASGACSATITLPDNTANYEVRATTLYKDSKTVTVMGVTNSGTAHFMGAQAVVDVTGQDQDELRRIQARVALTSTGSAIPANALSGANGVCKHFLVLPTGTVNAATAGACN